MMSLNELIDRYLLIEQVIYDQVTIYLRIRFTNLKVSNIKTTILCVGEDIVTWINWII